MVYLGSKARIAKYLAPVIQGYVDSSTQGYLEPFVGGANMIQHINHAKRYGCDSNNYLIALLKYIQNLNNAIPETITEDEYNDVHRNPDYYDEWYVGLVGFTATFGAKFFGGYARDKKTGRNIPRERIKNLSKQRVSLQNIEFVCCSYDEITFAQNLVIYCDPPYANSTKYYNDFNHTQFWQWVRKLSRENIVLVSEYNAPDDFRCIFEKQVTTALTVNSKYKVDTEKLFIYR